MQKRRHNNDVWLFIFLTNNTVSRKTAPFCFNLVERQPISIIFWHSDT